jgi:hypothetical protein
MIYRASAISTQKFLSLPETGMGYQVIEIRDIYQKRFVVYNSELILDDDTDFSRFKNQILTNGYQVELRKSRALSELENKSYRVLAKSSIDGIMAMDENKKNSKKRHSGGRGATDNPIEHADGMEYFVRLSAYEDDKRVDAIHKCLLAGSYATTFQDYKDCVICTDDPVDRYALPNDEKIQWAFLIRPECSNTLQRGIVQPANKHVGGGIEVFFENGTSDNTYISKQNYEQ